MRRSWPSWGRGPPGGCFATYLIVWQHQATPMIVLAAGRTT
ncbi:hypothetical protein [Streptomyces sp. NPDC007100]